MKLDKEYPATHSMSTAWYIADEEGNVGILKFDDNGPVPYGIGEYSLEELVLGVKEQFQISLEDDQIFEILDKPYEKDETRWSFCIIKIDPQRTEEFLSLVNQDKRFIEQCISKRLGLYAIEGLYCVDDDDNVIPDSLLDKVVKSGIIQDVYKDLGWISASSEWENGNVKFSKRFNSLPYYIYVQPYWPGYLCNLLNVPKHPVKIGQIPEKFRKYVLRLPIKFKDTQSLQIAKWAPCNILSSPENITIDSCQYTLLPYDQSNMAFFLIDFLAANNNALEKLCGAQWGLNYKAFGLYPTIIVFHGPEWEEDFLNEDFSDLTASSLHTQFLTFDKVYTGRSWTLSEKERTEIVDQVPMAEIFSKNHALFDFTVNRFRPNAIIIDDKYWDVITHVYSVNNHRISISGMEYVLFKASEMDENKAYLTELAHQEYRGKRFKTVISIDKMKQLVPDLKIPSDEDDDD